MCTTAHAAFDKASSLHDFACYGSALMDLLLLIGREVLQDLRAALEV